ncbi:MAG: hypothetical protein M3Z08_02780 [Chloroflexota bacterium]|nr:hypothetical protein [Chloroflexota bacterium]
MTNDEIGGIVSFCVFFILPILIGLIFVIKAKTLIRWRLRFLSEYGGEDLEPSERAITIYQIVGWFFIIAPVLVFLIGILMAMNQFSY